MCCWLVSFHNLSNSCVRWGEGGLWKGILCSSDDVRRMKKMHGGVRFNSSSTYSIRMRECSGGPLNSTQLNCTAPVHWTSSNKKWLSTVRDLKSSPPPPSIHTPHMSCKSPTRCTTDCLQCKSIIYSLLLSVNISEHIFGDNPCKTDRHSYSYISCTVSFVISSWCYPSSV